MASINKIFADFSLRALQFHGELLIPKSMIVMGNSPANLTFGQCGNSSSDVDEFLRTGPIEPKDDRGIIQTGKLNLGDD